MNKKMKTILFAFLAAIGAAMIAAVLFYLADMRAKGTLGNWFEDQFILKWSYISGASGQWITESSFRWETFKNFVLALLAAAAGLWGASIVLTAAISRKQGGKKEADRIGALLHARLSDKNVAFPEKYQALETIAREMEERMEQKERSLQMETAQKNDLIAYLAHDLKTPLTSVIGYLSLLEEAPELPTEQRIKYVHITREKALRLESLINELFDITRYNLHEIVLDKTEANVSYLLEQMADEFYPLLSAHGNRVELSVEEPLTAQLDTDKIARVFNNILKNAIGYSDPGTAIQIVARKEGKNITVAFIDQGKTIPEQKLKTIFEKFYRLDESRATNTGGAGLGLAIAKQIVTAHGGTIQAESRDHVTTFTVELPVEEEEML